MKRTLSIILAVIMIMTAVPFSAYAQEEHTHSLVEAETEDKTASYTYCDSDSPQSSAVGVQEKNAYARVNVAKELYPESEHPLSLIHI